MFEYPTQCLLCAALLPITKKPRKRIRKFCSVKCSSAYNSNKIKGTTSKTLNNCLCCSKPTYNPNYCSNSCSAKINNSVNPKRKAKMINCITCGKLVKKSNGRLKCSICITKERTDWDKITLGEIKQRYTTARKHTYIRDSATLTFKRSGKERKCLLCGYDTHVNICHIKPIAKFSDDSVLSEINALTNLVALCPNHHWELDHHLLSQEQLDKIIGGPTRI